MKRWNTELVPDMRAVVDSLSKTREVVGITVGDIVFDNLPLLRSYAASFKNMKITMFQCIGNHDFDKRYKGLNTRALVPEPTARWPMRLCSDLPTIRST